MATLPEVLKAAVESQNWELVCKAYTGITGEPLEVPVPKPTIPDWSNFEVNVDLGREELYELGHNRPMEDPEPSVPDLHKSVMPKAGEIIIYEEPQTDFEDDDDEVELSDEDVASLLTSMPPDEDMEQAFGSNEEDTVDFVADKPQKKKSLTKPSIAGGGSRSTESFIAQSKGEHGFAPRINEDGKIEARKSPMNIPVVRKNLFHDNKEVFKDELVSNNPELGTPTQVARGQRSLIEGAVDTGSKVDVMCSLCDKEEVVSARLAVGWNPDPENNTYKCNDCNTNAGRAKVSRLLRQKLNDGPQQRGRTI